MGDITSQSSLARHDAAMTSISSKILVVTVIIVFLMLALLFIVHIYAKWYWSRHVHEDPRLVSWRRRTAHQGRAGTRTRGLDSRALELVPEVEFDPKKFHEGLECAVCLSEVTLGEKIRLLPKCSHGFHVTCIDMWFNSHTTCPLCRTPVVFDQNTIHLQEIEVSTSSESESESESDNETRVRSFRQPSEEASTSTRSSGNGLVIDIPRQVFCEDCLSSPRLGDKCDDESSKSPVLTTLRSFRRLLSRGKRVVPSPHGSSSVETEQV